ncbi:hypothetical protein ACIA5E_18455 [Nocardia asteroides]|uniref:hypothetical protein n=1 Tax=Nocardia asteroides TaxID=1824 RepID=UPI0037B0CA12
MSFVTQGTNYTDPAYYRDAEPLEAQLRAAFATHHQLREIAPWGETPSVVVEYAARAYDIARQWQASTPEHQQLWQQLSSAAEVWTSDPEGARAEFGRLQQAFIEGNSGIDAATIRTQRQAAELTGRLEPLFNHSTQDGSRWRPRHLSLVTDPNATSPQRSVSAADRALGGRAPEQLSLAEIDAIIDATDEVLSAEELAGDLDNGVDELNALIPAQRRSTPATSHDYTGDLDRHRAQIDAVRLVQDLTAEHLRLAGQFDGTVQGGQALIERMDTLIEATHTARRTAAGLGVDDGEIAVAYRTGLTGQYWSQQPAVPRLAQLDQAIGQPDRALAHIDTWRTESGVQAPVPTWAVGSEPAALGSVPGSVHSPGAAIESAVEAALPEFDVGGDWTSPEIGGVIDAPQREPAVDHHL